MVKVVGRFSFWFSSWFDYNFVKVDVVNDKSLEVEEV